MFSSFALKHKKTSQKSTRETLQRLPNVTAQTHRASSGSSPQKCDGRVSSLSGSSGETEAGTCKAIVKAAKTDPIASMQSSPGDD